MPIVVQHADITRQREKEREFVAKDTFFFSLKKLYSLFKKKILHLPRPLLPTKRRSLNFAT
jgi:hypothetical protein